MSRPGGERGFLRGFLVLFAGSLLGKVAGLAREVIFAAAFGSGVVATGFKSAQSAVLVSANLVTGDVLSAAFVPTYARLHADEPERAQRLLWAYVVAYGTVMTGVAALLFGVRHGAMDLMIPGASPEVRALAGDVLGALAWCIPLFGVASIAGYALATDGRYTATSLRATLQTAGLLLGTVVAVLLGSPVWLAGGFVLAWVAYTAWCFSLLARHGLLGPFSLGETREALRLVGANLLSVMPLMVIPAGIQVATVAQRVIASHGDPALIASVDYAQTLSDSLVTLVSVPLGFVGLTQLATLREGDFLRTTRRILSLVIGLGLPATFLALPLTGVLVQLVYRRGSFDATAVLLTSQVAFGLFCGMTVQVLGYALTRALSARRRNRAVLWITLTGLVVEIGVQALSLPTGDPVFIGLGISAYGLVLTVLASTLLGIHGRLLSLLAAGAPAIGISVLALAVPGLSPFVAAGIVVVAWGINLAVAPPYRAVLADVAGLLLRRRRAKAAPVETPMPTPAREPVAVES
jgi:peptidoglycan biosynthesis protein MviN/MurJ (putative lipid II flippase)